MLIDYLSNKSGLMSKYRLHDKDSGSVFVQVALLCARIGYLSLHIEKNKGDVPAKRSLLVLVQKRRKMLQRAFAESKETYSKIIADFGIRDIAQKKATKLR
ncbi:MAG: 30S ribosomal protein S15 [Alphaproteobacteria bacterium]|nr:30S ribosomal protein S15 [Rickettsiales bacterium]